MQDGPDALIGLSGADGQKGAAGLEHGQCGDDLLEALLHHDGDQPVGGFEDGLQLVGQREGTVGEFAEVQNVVLRRSRR